jgi:purine nucleosidase
VARQIVIDTDPGIDDAVALLLALACPKELTVAGVVAVGGNLALVATERNARAVCELAGRPEVPVHAGCARPLLSPPGGSAVHADDGLGGIKLPPPVQPLRPQHGVDFIIETLRAAKPKTVTLCALGPLTDIALALVKAPDIAPRVAEVVLMGGAGFEIGNITPAAEFNIHADPHAAAIVLASAMPITMIPLDATYKALTTLPRLDALRSLGNRCGRLAADMLASFERARTGKFGERGAALHDPCVIAYLLRPDLFGGRVVNVAVETAGELTSGMTVVDWWGVTDRPANARFLTEADADGVFRLLTERLAHLP